MRSQIPEEELPIAYRYSKVLRCHLKRKAGILMTICLLKGGEKDKTAG